jgi:hypothetical protein
MICGKSSFVVERERERGPLYFFKNGLATFLPFSSLHMDLDDDGYFVAV